jgi:hypothetical protein
MASDRIGSALGRLHATMARLRLNHPALRSPHMEPPAWETWQTQFDPNGRGFDAARQLAIYNRWAALEDGTTQSIVIALNFSDTD